MNDCIVLILSIVVMGLFFIFSYSFLLGVAGIITLVYNLIIKTVKVFKE